MTSRLIHRGPDAVGHWVESGVALGHRRLSILDLTSAGAQPMHSDCGRFVIVFNGEIYNHSEMRLEMEGGGSAQVWRSYSDTETLLVGFKHWGINGTLKRANGMFSLAVWDRRDRVLSLARDRIGEKPLYWGWCGSTLVFGSELKALREYPEFPTEICRKALAQYFRFAYVPAPRTIHPSLYKLEPGCILEIHGDPPPRPPSDPLRPGDQFGSLSIRRYWSLAQEIDTGRADQVLDETEALELTASVMRNAVKRQMLADVPLGAFLSGGVDSSLIVALMQEQSLQPVKTFTIGFQDSNFDESRQAAAVARHLGTYHSELIVTDVDAIKLIPRLADMYDEPFADSSQIPTHFVCHLARQDVKVALSGDAGDELFGGYNRYFWGSKIWKKVDNIPMPVRRLLGSAILSMPVDGWDKVENVYNSCFRGSSGIKHAGDKAHRLASRLRSVRTNDDLYRSLINVWDDPPTLVPDGAESSSLLDDPYPHMADDGLADMMMFQDLRCYLPDDILCKVDRAAMAIGLETRVPFLDLDVIALSTRLPMRMKIRGSTGKVALRRTLDRYVPRELIERPKMGFGIPVGDWLRGPLRDWAEDLLSPQKLGADGLLMVEPIRLVWQEHLMGRRDWTHRLWAVLMFQAWRERWC